MAGDEADSKNKGPARWTRDHRVSCSVTPEGNPHRWSRPGQTSTHCGCSLPCAEEHPAAIYRAVGCGEPSLGQIAVLVAFRAHEAGIAASGRSASTMNPPWESERPSIVLVATGVGLISGLALMLLSGRLPMVLSAIDTRMWPFHLITTGLGVAGGVPYRLF